MTTLRDVIQAVRPQHVIGLADGPVDAVACHPANVAGHHVLFGCMDEYLEYNRWQTWQTHLNALPGMPLAAVMTPAPIPGLNVPQLIVAEPRKALGRASRVVTGCPDEGMVLYGITGTNGKTTTTRLLGHILSTLGLPCGSIGTLGLLLTDRLSLPGTYTTPLAPELYACLSQLRQAGAHAAALEVSSHGLALDRVEGLTFRAVAVTNVMRDHLDFHGTQEAYVAAKQLLFAKVAADGLCLINRHSAYCDDFRRVSAGRVITFGYQGSGADFEIADVHVLPAHSAFTIHYQGKAWPVETRMAGAFQVENAATAMALVVASGYAGEDVAEALRSFDPVSGRMERIAMPNGASAIVDYAHNPDGLKHVLATCRELCAGRLHVVFGCGGDRDRGKRSLMGALAAELADVAWVTSDNPRTEDPQDIVNDVLAGMQNGSAELHTDVDRARAIRSAYASTAAADVLLVAGKGHEDYQIIGTEKHPFSDQAVLRALGGS